MVVPGRVADALVTPRREQLAIALDLTKAASFERHASGLSKRTTTAMQGIQGIQGMDGGLRLAEDQKGLTKGCGGGRLAAHAQQLPCATTPTARPVRLDRIVRARTSTTPTHARTHAPSLFPPTHPPRQRDTLLST